jgi:hypothetical protein
MTKPCGPLRRPATALPSCRPPLPCIPQGKQYQFCSCLPVKYCLHFGPGPCHLPKTEANYRIDHGYSCARADRAHLCFSLQWLCALLIGLRLRSWNYTDHGYYGIRNSKVSLCARLLTSQVTVSLPAQCTDYQSRRKADPQMVQLYGSPAVYPGITDPNGCCIACNNLPNGACIGWTFDPVSGCNTYSGTTCANAQLPFYAFGSCIPGTYLFGFGPCGLDGGCPSHNCGCQN